MTEDFLWTMQRIKQAFAAKTATEQSSAASFTEWWGDSARRMIGIVLDIAAKEFQEIGVRTREEGADLVLSLLRPGGYTAVLTYRPDFVGRRVIQIVEMSGANKAANSFGSTDLTREIIQSQVVDFMRQALGVRD